MHRNRLMMQRGSTSSMMHKNLRVFEQPFRQRKKIK